MQNMVTVEDATWILADGKTLWTKYQNISELEGDNHVFLASNGKLAVSLIQASKEYFDGGPTKQELTVHDYYDGEILLWHPHTGHYGSPAVTPDKGWEKIFGPFLLHLTESAVSTDPAANVARSEEHTSELQSRQYLVCRLLLDKKTHPTSNH